MNTSDRLADLYTIRQLLLNRLAAGEQARMTRQMLDISKEIERRLKTGKPLTEFQGQRLNKAIAELQKLVQITGPNFGELAALEAAFARQAFASVSIDAALPGASVIDRIANRSLVQGATISDWFERISSQIKFDIERAVKTGVILGDTNAQIASAIVGDGTRGPEAFPRGRRDVMAVTRTAVQTVANDARLATFEANADVIKAVQWISTLDSRTSDICIARSGLVWTLPGYKPQGHNIEWQGPPPAHWACRSTVIPITKTFRELGLDIDEVPLSTRASMDGQVAADLTFADWLGGKPPEFADEMLGKGRAALWRDGKITLNQLLDQQGNPLTLAQLRSKYGATESAFKPAATPKPNISDIDQTILSVKAFEFTPEYNATKARMDDERKAVIKARDDFYATGRTDKDKYKDALAANEAYSQTAKQFRAIENAESKRMVSIVAAPTEIRGNAKEVIASGYNVNYRKNVEEAASIVSAIIHKDIMPRNIKVQGVKSNRAYYQSGSRAININKDTSVSVIVHEIVHDIEYSHPEISQKTKAFLLKRSNGEKPKSLRKLTGVKGFKADEVAYEDEWQKRGGSHYMGKVYDRASTELLTMGIERTLADAKSFAEQDPEYFRFMLEIFRKID